MFQFQELLSLSGQLQSEKATVSRAVAQNKELKEQLFETEDRLVALTNEKMQCELDKQAAEHQVRVLTEQLNQNGNGEQMMMENAPDSTVHDHLGRSYREKGRNLKKYSRKMGFLTFWSFLKKGTG